jgi:hypothetical protein
MQTLTYDFETLSNFTCAVFQNVTTHEFQEYVWYGDRNDTEPFLKLICARNEFVSFNGDRFDDQVCQFIYENDEELAALTGDEVAKKVYGFAQELISAGRDQFPPYYRGVRKVRSIDLFKIHHFDNAARSTSLKALQVNMKSPKVLEMPIDHWEFIEPHSVSMILEYCRNDVRTTTDFFHHSDDALRMRQGLRSKYGLDFMAMSDSSIGEEIFVQELCKKTKMRRKELKKLRTYRDSIDLGKCVAPYVKFDTPLFQGVLDHFNDTVLASLNDSFGYTINFQDMEVVYGLGGAHGSIPAGVYVESDSHGILDVDVASMYPNIAIRNGFRPKHLPASFCDIYEEIFETRKTIPKKNPMNGAYKIALNSVYGKSNDINSFLYDPAFTQKICATGQLSISMLMERLDGLVDFISVNTDGVCFRYERSRLDEIRRVCSEWENVTRLSLEETHYKKYVCRDVNNYIAETISGDVKTKGCFLMERGWHQNISSMVVPKALKAHYIDGVDIEEFIESHDVFYDFIIRLRYRGKDFGEQGKFRFEKNVRFYVGKKGKSLVSNKWVSLKGRPAPVLRQFDVAGRRPVHVVNDLVGVSEETLLKNVDREYYVVLAFDIVNMVEPNRTRHGEQLTLL